MLNRVNQSCEEMSASGYKARPTNWTGDYRQYRLSTGGRGPPGDDQIYSYVFHQGPQFTNYRDVPAPGNKMIRKIDNLGEVYAVFGDRVGNNYQWDPTVDRLYLVNVTWSKLLAYHEPDDPIQENQVHTHLMKKIRGDVRDMDEFYSHSRWDGYKVNNLFGNQAGLYLKDLDPSGDKVMIIMRADNSGKASADARQLLRLPMNKPMPSTSAL